MRGKLREKDDKVRMGSHNNEVAHRLQWSAARDKGSPKVGRSDSPKKRHRPGSDNFVAIRLRFGAARAVACAVLSAVAHSWWMTPLGTADSTAYVRSIRTISPAYGQFSAWETKPARTGFWNTYFHFSA